MLSSLEWNSETISYHAHTSGLFPFAQEALANLSFLLRKGGSLPFLPKIVSQQNEGEIALHGRTVFRKSLNIIEVLMFASTGKRCGSLLQDLLSTYQIAQATMQWKALYRFANSIPLSPASPHLGGILMISNH